MTDFDTDEARIERRKRLVEVRPLAAREAINKSDYVREYVDPCVVVIDNLKSAEEATKSLFCPCCRNDLKNGLTEVRRLHVGYEHDPLNNYPAIATVRCAGCDYFEMIPVIREEPSIEERRDVHEYEVSQGLNTASAFHNRNQQKQAQLAQAYGMGSNGILGQQYQPGMWVHDEYMMSAPPMAAPPPFKAIGYGQQIADEIWAALDRDEKAKAYAKEWREDQKQKAARQQVMKDAGKHFAMAIDNDIYKQLAGQLDTGKIRKAIDMLDKQNVPMPTEAPKPVDKQWYKRFYSRYAK